MTLLLLRAQQKTDGGAVRATLIFTEVSMCYKDPIASSFGNDDLGPVEFNQFLRRGQILGGLY